MSRKIIITIGPVFDKHWWINCGVLLLALTLGVIVTVIIDYYLVEDFRILVDNLLGE